MYAMYKSAMASSVKVHLHLSNIHVDWLFVPMIYSKQARGQGDVRAHDKPRRFDSVFPRWAWTDRGICLCLLL